MLQIRPKLRVTIPQTAQGMVEFALVLPILLLIILGIFAFGHLFFAYTSVVSASREAARWGSASGVSESMRPRYSDCASIRATAERVGSFAGVAAVDSPDEATPGVEVTFDHGPTTLNPVPVPFEDCSDNLGAETVVYGDRINVRVTVLYNPIVPLVPIPSFPLSATTSRTIIKGVPVGDPPAAASTCPTTTIIVEIVPMVNWPPQVPAIMPVPPIPPQVNQPVDVRVRVIASNGSSPTGIVDLVDHDPNDPDDVHTCTVNATSADPGNGCFLRTGLPLVPAGYESIGTKYITAQFDNQGTCFVPSELVDEPFQVAKGDSFVVITSDDPDPSWPYNPAFPETADAPDTAVDVRFDVYPYYPRPGSTYPNGTLAIPRGGRVTVTDTNGNDCTDMTIDSAATIPVLTGTGACTFLPTADTLLTASYNGDVNFNPSGPSAPEPHAIRVGPTPTPDPECPYLVGDVYFNPDDYMQLQIANDGADTAVDNIDYDWSLSPNIVGLLDIRFGNLAELNTCTTLEGTADGPIDCLWQSPDQLNGTTTQMESFTNGVPVWNGQAAPLAGGTSKYMRFTFTGAPQPGPYYFNIAFNNGCSIERTLERP